ncbi:hypothetical protein AAEU33_00030 [Chryseobacterium sp. Chry.R1]
MKRKFLTNIPLAVSGVLLGGPAASLLAQAPKEDINKKNCCLR